MVRWRNGRTAADAWCAAALWPGSPPSAGVVREWIAAATGAPTTLPAGAAASIARPARATWPRGHSAFHWELAFPEVFFDASGQPSRTRRLRRGDWQSAVGHLACRHRLGIRTSRRETCDCGGASLLPRLPLLRQPHQRTSEQLSAVPRPRVAADAKRRPHRADPALRHRHRSRQRGAASTSLRSHHDRHLDRLRQSPPHFPDPSQHAICRADRPRTTARPRRCGSAAVSPISTSCTRQQTSGAPLAVVALADRVVEPGTPDHSRSHERNVARHRHGGRRSRAGAWRSRRAGACRFGRELNATDDRPHFRRAARGAPHCCRSSKANSCRRFRSTSDDRIDGIPASAASRLLTGAPFARARIGYRDVASATNKLTLIAAMLPANVVSTHTVFCLKSDLDDRSQWCLLGLMNSLVANYLVRLNVTTHVTAALMSRLPVPQTGASTRAHSIDSSRLRNRSPQRASTATIAAYAELNAIAGESLRSHDTTVRVHPRVVSLDLAFATAALLRGFAWPQTSTETRKHRNTETDMDIPALHNHITDSILRCAVAVHRGLGPGLPEHSYQASLALEFDANGIRYDRRPHHRSSIPKCSCRLASARLHRRRRGRRRTQGRDEHRSRPRQAGADLSTGDGSPRRPVTELQRGDDDYGIKRYQL